MGELGPDHSLRVFLHELGDTHSCRAHDTSAARRTGARQDSCRFLRMAKFGQKFHKILEIKPSCGIIKESKMF